MPTTRQVLESTIALEKETMGLYARFAKLFAGEDKLRDFWFAMARDEAAHVGILELVAKVLDIEGKLDVPSPISLENATIVRLRALLERCARESEPVLTITQALGAAVEIEETEVEDLVGDLLKTVLEAGEYERYLRLLVHDLGDLSYMIEQRAHDAELLRRCDALVDRHAEALRRSALH